MKKIFVFIALFTGLALQAQDRLEPYRQYDEDTPLCSKFYEQELWRLLNPNDSKWGVIICPSLMTESSLVYDAATRSLVYTEINGILWGNVRDATTERVEEGNSVRYISLDEVTNYTAPDTKVLSMPLPDKMAEKLKALWLTALSTTAENDLNVLDGCTYKFFVDGKKAKSNGTKSDWVRVQLLQKLVDNLVKAVREQNNNMLLQRMQEVEDIYLLFEKTATHSGGQSSNLL